MPSSHEPTDPSAPQRPEADHAHAPTSEPDASEERRTSWRLRRRDAKDRAAAEERIRNQGTWVDVQVQQAMARGDFDDLPGYGKPLKLRNVGDPDWFAKQLVERENITGVLPPALQIRKDDAALDGVLDRLNTEKQVREAVTDFNAAVRRALYTTWGDPPVITPQRDVETEVDRWRSRRPRR